MNPLTLAPDRVHLAYTEPHPDHGSWTSPPRCLPERATADRVRDAVTALAGPDARARRSWTISPCDCSGEVGRYATDFRSSATDLGGAR